MQKKKEISQVNLICNKGLNNIKSGRIRIINNSWKSLISLSYKRVNRYLIKLISQIEENEYFHE